MTAGQRLAGRRAVVTGGSSGMGRAIVELFTEEGASVLAVARREAELVDAHAGAAGRHWLSVDICDEGAAARIVAYAEEVLGGIDIVVNAAGAFEMAPFDADDDGVWIRAFNTNFHAPRNLCRAALPALKRSSAGRIINIGSVSVHLTQSRMAAYNSSKHALTGLTMSLAVELSGFGITANIIHPGFIDTAMSKALVDDPVLSKAMNSKIGVGRIGHADEIADAALWLAGPQCAYTTGQAVRVDGGYGSGVYDMFGA